MQSPTFDVQHTVESVHLGDLPAFVVAAQQQNLVRPSAKTMARNTREYSVDERGIDHHEDKALYC